MDKEKENQTTQDASLMHELGGNSKTTFFSMKLITFLLVFAFLGVGTGYFLSGIGADSSGITDNVSNLTGGGVQKGETYGDGDPEVFTDTAEGVVREGGIEGEGQFHLIQTNNPDNPAALTSSIVDLSQFEGKEVKVWGKTFDAQKAGWLMDVGIVEVL